MVVYSSLAREDILINEEIEGLPWCQWLFAFYGGEYQQELFIKGMEKGDIPALDGLPILFMREDTSFHSSLIHHWLRSKETKELAITAMGISGYPAHCNTLFSLLHKTEDIYQQKLIANSIRLITGIYFESIEEQAEEEIIDMCAIDFLPFPDKVSMQELWNRVRGNFQLDVRYRNGQILNRENLTKQINKASQVDRAIASLEYATLMKTIPENVHAPYWRYDV